MSSCRIVAGLLWAFEKIRESRRARVVFPLLVQPEMAMVMGAWEDILGACRGC